MGCIGLRRRRVLDRNITRLTRCAFNIESISSVSASRRLHLCTYLSQLLACGNVVGCLGRRSIVMQDALIRENLRSIVIEKWRNRWMEGLGGSRVSIKRRPVRCEHRQSSPSSVIGS